MSRTIRHCKFKLVTTIFDAALTKASDERKGIPFKTLHVKSPIIDPDTKRQAVDKDGNLQWKTCGSLVGERDYCKGHCGEDLADKTAGHVIGKGYEIGKNRYASIPVEELAAVKVETSDYIDVQQLVTWETFLRYVPYINGALYNILPMENNPVVYATVMHMLQGRVAIARTAMYGREHTVAVTPGQSCLQMYMLRYPNELRAAEHVPLPAVPAMEARMGEMIVQEMLTDEIRLDYPDTFVEAVQGVVDRNLAGLAPSTATETVPTQATRDVTASLQASLELLKGNKRKMAKVEEPTEKPKTTRRKKAA